MGEAKTVALALVAFFLGVLWGNVLGYNLVKDDCRKLGAFYVQSAVFECKEKK